MGNSKEYLKLAFEPMSTPVELDAVHTQAGMISPSAANTGFPREVCHRVSISSDDLRALRMSLSAK